MEIEKRGMNFHNDLYRYAIAILANGKQDMAFHSTPPSGKKTNSGFGANDAHLFELKHQPAVRNINASVLFSSVKIRIS